MCASRLREVRLQCWPCKSLAHCAPKGFWGFFYTWNWFWLGHGKSSQKSVEIPEKLLRPLLTREKLQEMSVNISAIITEDWLADWAVVCLMCSAGVCTVSIPVHLHPVNLRLSVQRLVMPTNEIIWQSVGVLGSISDEHKKEYRALVGNLWSGLKGIIWLCVRIRTETMTDFNRKRTALWPVSILRQDADVMFEYKPPH